MSAPDRYLCSNHADVLNTSTYETSKSLYLFINVEADGPYITNRSERYVNPSLASPDHTCEYGFDSSLARYCNRVYRWSVEDREVFLTHAEQQDLIKCQKKAQEVPA